MKLRTIEKKKGVAELAQKTLRACWKAICEAEKAFDRDAGDGWFAYAMRESDTSIAGDVLIMLVNEYDVPSWARDERKKLRAELDEHVDEDVAEDDEDGADGDANTDLRAVDATEALAAELHKLMRDVRRVGAKTGWPDKILEALTERVDDDSKDLDAVVARWIAPFDAAVLMARPLEAHCPKGRDEADEYRDAVIDLLFNDDQ